MGLVYVDWKIVEKECIYRRIFQQNRIVSSNLSSAWQANTIGH